MTCFNWKLDWDAISTIVTAIMALIALISVLQNKKQFRNENRARLVFEIISYQNEFMLKIMNVGKSTAYDVKMCFKSNLIENHYAESIKSNFEQINKKKLVMAPGRCIYILLSPAYTSKQSSHTIGGQKYSTESINTWLDKYKDEKIVITGCYCRKYKIKEKIAITDFLGPSAIIYDNNTIALHDIKKELKQNNENGKSIIAMLNGIINTYSHTAEDDNKNKEYE